MQRSWYYDPTYDPMSPNITCGYTGQPVSGSFHLPVKAGDVITGFYTNDYDWSLDNGSPYSCYETTPKSQCTLNQWQHCVGPLSAWLADCGGDCNKVEPSTLKWFKFAEAGHIDGISINSCDGWQQRNWFDPGKDFMGKDGWPVTIPKTLKPGNYMLRHEVMMIELMPVQIYTQCAHLTISGEGTSFPTEEYLVRFPGAYKITGIFNTPLTCHQ
jgi:hypothetical protein